MGFEPRPHTWTSNAGGLLKVYRDHLCSSLSFVIFSIGCMGPLSPCDIGLLHSLEVDAVSLSQCGVDVLVSLDRSSLFRLARKIAVAFVNRCYKSYSLVAVYSPSSDHPDERPWAFF